MINERYQAAYCCKPPSSYQLGSADKFGTFVFTGHIDQVAARMAVALLLLSLLQFFTAAVAPFPAGIF